MSSFPWLRKGSKTSSGLKTAPIKSAPFPAFPEFPIPSPPGLLPAITTLFLEENKSGFFLPVAPVHIPEADPTPPTAGFWELFLQVLSLEWKKSALCAQLSF